ncbi:MAG: hypothetical protein ACFFAN_20335 [Promethearchaeota archaeon]
MYIWNEYAKGVGPPEWIMIQISRIGQKVGEIVKKEMVKTEVFIAYETKKIVDKLRKRSIQEMEEFIKERNLRKAEKKRKKLERKKRDRLYRQMGYVD